MLLAIFAAFMLPDSIKNPYRTSKPIAQKVETSLVTSRVVKASSRLGDSTVDNGPSHGARIDPWLAVAAYEWNTPQRLNTPSKLYSPMRLIQ